MLASFRYEQADPARFYGPLADDSVSLIADFYADHTARDLAESSIVDVGAGPGYFERAFAATGAHYVSVEPDPSELHAAGFDGCPSVRGSGTALPFRSGTVDICFSSNVAEHVPDPWDMATEMLRVTRPGGLTIISYTVWLGPFGGHETGPWHYFGGERAARRYRRVHGREPKNRFGTSLFPIGVADGLRWAVSESGAEVVAAFPRYHPRWAWWITRVPGIRELLTSNLVIVLSPPGVAAGPTDRADPESPSV